MPTHQGGPISMTMVYQSAYGTSATPTSFSFNDSVVRALTQTSYSTPMSIGTASRGARLVNASQTPLYGAQGVGESGSPFPTWPATNGAQTITSLLDNTPIGSDDYHYGPINLGFTFYIGGTGYTQVYVGTNSYLTFGGYSNTNTPNASDPAYDKIVIGGADRRARRIGYYTVGGSTQTTSDTNFYCAIRYEGYTFGESTSTASTVWECTIWNPSSVGNLSCIELRMGNMTGVWGSGATPGYSAIANSSTAYRTFTPTANQSITFFGSNNGTYWTTNTNSYPTYSAAFTGVFTDYYMPKTFY